ncbi:MAG: hypothetical protein Q9171_004909 [Xanthocarpia ochracea]
MADKFVKLKASLKKMTKWLPKTDGHFQIIAPLGMLGTRRREWGELYAPVDPSVGLELVVTHTSLGKGSDDDASTSAGLQDMRTTPIEIPIPSSDFPAKVHQPRWPPPPASAIDGKPIA